VYKDFKEIKELFKIEEEYLPDKAKAQFYDKKFEIFLKSYQGLLESYDLIADLENFSSE